MQFFKTFYACSQYNVQQIFNFFSVDIGKYVAVFELLAPVLQEKECCVRIFCKKSM
jgi:hypothetical protein